MAFHDVLLPTDISEGAVGGPGYKTQIVKTDSGYEHRIARWSTPLHRYDVSYGIRTHVQLAALKDFYMARQGAAYSFRFKDWTDYTTSTSGQNSPSMLDHPSQRVDATHYQLVKKYASGAQTHSRKIGLPVTGTVLAAVDGVLANPQPSVDFTTGILTFATDIDGVSVVTAGCEFDVPVRFAESADDQLALSIKEVGIHGIGSVELIEVLDPVPNEEDYYYGGSSEQSLTGDVSVSPSEARWYSFTCLNDQNVNLPLITDVQEWSAGGPYFYIKNNNPTSGGYGNLYIKSDGDLVYTLWPSYGCVVCLSIDYTEGTYVWRAM